MGMLNNTRGKGVESRLSMQGNGQRVRGGAPSLGPAVMEKRDGAKMLVESRRGPWLATPPDCAPPNQEATANHGGQSY